MPDVAQIRNDIAWHYDSVNEMAAWIRRSKLDELKASGEAENTIVFFYSDHGGCLPRGKAYLYDTGARVPLMVLFPEKYNRLVGVKVTLTNDNLVGFVDFSPILFNLLDVKIPFMLGQPLLDKNLPSPKSEFFLYRANQEQNYIPSRALTDGRYKFICNFNSAYPNGTRQSYQWQMSPYQGWDDANMKDEVNELQSVFWKPTAVSEFFDTKTDPYEVKKNDRLRRTSRFNSYHENEVA